MPRRRLVLETVPGTRIRYITHGGKPLFVASDVAREAGYKTPAAATSTWTGSLVQLTETGKQWRFVDADQAAVALYRSKAPAAHAVSATLQLFNENAL